MKGLVESLRDFYKGKRVLVTGHTGLKGSWLALWLSKMGAKILGISLPPSSELGHFTASAMGSLIKSEFIDIRDFDALKTAFDHFKPEVVFHLAAQAIVGSAYEDPLGTFEVNVLGSVNVLECVRRNREGVAAVVMITSDKCYDNIEQIWGYREIDRLGGDEPYSASKACAENAIRAYTKSYFSGDASPSIASARAGNIVGGGDWSKFRLVPDCIRSLRKGEHIQLRNPASTRPWQFVLDALAGYMALAQRLATDGKKFSGAWNFGPPVNNNTTVERSAREIIRNWGSGELEIVSNNLFHENSFLQLDCTKARQYLLWQTVLDFSQTMAMTTAWYKKQYDSRDNGMRDFSYSQLEQFEDLLSKVSHHG